MRNKYLCEVQFGTRGMGYGITVDNHKIIEAAGPEEAWNEFVKFLNGGVEDLNNDITIENETAEIGQDLIEPFEAKWSEAMKASNDGYLYGWSGDDMIIEMRTLGPVEIGDRNDAR